jgi:hypothetical protein
LGQLLRAESLHGCAASAQRNDPASPHWGGEIINIAVSRNTQGEQVMFRTFGQYVD